MRSVLGIDAAWTARNPSGVALIVDNGDGWKLVCVESSYTEFVHRDPALPSPPIRPTGSIADARLLLEAAGDLAGSPVDLVAIDMPLSRKPITGRRISDNLVSTAWGSRHCGTHSPSAERPGQISDDLREAFEALGYPLATVKPRYPGLYEVYPHPALVELTNAARRLPYKASKQRNYWPELTPPKRRLRIWAVWRAILTSLEGVIPGTARHLAMPALDAKGFEMKAFEDKLDAIVCAWVGACVMDGAAVAYGDDESAIWIPAPR